MLHTIKIFSKPMTNEQTRVNTVIIHESLKQTQAARFD